jgi:hypothetical protein
LEIREDGGVLAVRSQCFLSDRIQDAVLLDGCRCGIGKQGITDTVPRAEVGQNLPRIVADDGQPQAVLLKL